MNLRQAAQQALEALVTCCAEEWRTLNNFGMKQVYDEKKVNAAIAALHAALAEPERKPLTDEEIFRLMVGEDRVQLLYSKRGDPYFSEFAEGAIRELVESGRAIERAHGIGEQT